MCSRFEWFTKLRIFSHFLKEFEGRLKLVNDKGYRQFLPGPDLDFVHAQWVRALEQQEFLLTEDIFLLFGQDALGELCHGLARYDTVLLSGAKASKQIDAKAMKGIDFIADHKWEYFAIDFCAYAYREIMPFKARSYPATNFNVVRLCQDIRNEPLKARRFVKSLCYPDKLKLLN